MSKLISIPADEIITAMTDLSNGAYHLLMYHYTKGNGWRFNDKQMAVTLGTSERMIKAYRKELIQKEYLFITGKNPTVYFIGKKAVRDFKEPISTELEEDENIKSDNKKAFE